MQPAKLAPLDWNVNTVTFLLCFQSTDCKSNLPLFLLKATLSLLFE